MPRGWRGRGPRSSRVAAWPPTSTTPTRPGGRATDSDQRRAQRVRAIARRPRSPPRTSLIEPGSMALAELLAAAGDGVYVTDVAGLHSGVNPVSGQFSVGASGVLIEGGELGHPQPSSRSPPTWSRCSAPSARRAPKPAGCRSADPSRPRRC